MKALKVWMVSSQPVKRAIDLASSIPTRTSSSILLIRCCSYTATTTASKDAGHGGAAEAKPSGRNQSSLSTCSSPSSTSNIDAIRDIRLKKVEDLRAKGFEPYAYKWDRTHTANQLQDIYRNLQNGEESNNENDHVSVAGRIVACRVFGKLVFLTSRDASGTIQLYCEKERLSSDQFELLNLLVDTGDILGASGSIKRTEKGELSIYVNSFAMLTKSLLPLPDEHHGLTDKRYSRRCEDMIANPKVVDVIRKRSKIMSEIRKTMESFGFKEFDTPVFEKATGGTKARPFRTYHNALGMNLHLRIATEPRLKKLLVGGLEKVYETGPVFSNSGISIRHNPEFRTIEMYEAYSNYKSMMNMAEEIVTRCALSVLGKLTINYQGSEISLERPWRRETMHNLVKEATGIDFMELGSDLKVAKEVTLRKLGCNLDYKEKSSIEACPSIGHVLNEVFETFVQSKLLQPTIVSDYPIEISPLAKPHQRHAGLAERCELFAAGMELANICSVLTDPMEHRRRLEEQVRQHNENRAAKEKGEGDEDDSYEWALEDDFLRALECGMPPASGMGIWIDRLVMLLTNSASIQDVIAFPLVKNNHQC